MLAWALGRSGQATSWTGDAQFESVSPSVTTIGPDVSPSVVPGCGTSAGAALTWPV